MIKKLSNNDKEEVLAFLKAEPAFNLFAIGDIERYGCDSEEVEVWSEIIDGGTVGVLVRYFKSFLVYYNKDNADVGGFADIIKNTPQDIQFISGKSQNVKKFAEYFEYKKIRETYFCRLDKQIDNSMVDFNGVGIACAEDAQKVCDLRSQIDELTVKVTKEHIANNITNGFTRVYYIENEVNEFVSVSQTAAENSMAAMIVGVCTHPKYRRLGYMRRTMTKLCYDLQQEDKIICLFYDNKDAGRIYHSIGFETIGMWNMMDLRK